MHCHPLLLLGLAALAIPEAAASPSIRPDMPPEVLSWREAIAPREEYAKAVAAWRGYLDAHPRAAVAYIEMARAARYAQSASAEERESWVAKAFEIDPNCPEALLAYADLLNRKTLADPDYKPPAQARELARRAVRLAPSWPEPHLLLWSMALLGGEPPAADSNAAALLNKGAFNAPVVDFGYNLLISARPNAIIFTNGDNDTYPPVALQAARKIRPDVTIVNLSLLTAPAYEKEVWNGSGKAPAPFTAEETNQLRMAWGAAAETAAAGTTGAGTATAGKAEPRPYAEFFLHALGDKIAAGQYGFPTYFSVTVAPGPLASCGRVVELEGLLLRVLPDPATGDPEQDRRVAGERTLELLQKQFRLDSATSLTLQWREGSSARRLMRNYPAVLSMTAADRAARGDLEGVKYCLDVALRILEFHHYDQAAAQLRDYRDRVISQS